MSWEESEEILAPFQTLAIIEQQRNKKLHTITVAVQAVKHQQQFAFAFLEVVGKFLKVELPIVVCVTLT